MHTNVSMRGYKLDIQYSHKDEGARNIYGYWDKIRYPQYYTVLKTAN